MFFVKLFLFLLGSLIMAVGFIQLAYGVGALSYFHAAIGAAVVIIGYLPAHRGVNKAWI